MSAIDEFVARANIERFQRKLAEDTDQTMRNTLVQLLAEEEEKLATLEEAREESKEA